MQNDKNYISVHIRLTLLGNDDYQIQDGDPALEKVFSLSRKEVQGSSLKELFLKYSSNPLFNQSFWEEVKKQVPCGFLDWFFDPPGILFRVFVHQSKKELNLLLSELPSPLESTAFFQTLAHQNPVHVFYRYQLLPKPGFEYVSPSVTSVVGYTPEEHYRNPELGFQIVHPEDRHILKDLIQEGKGFGKLVVLRWQHKAGKTIWTEQLNIPIYDENGNLIAIEGIARDITGYKRNEEALRQKSREFEWLLKSMINAFVIHEPIFNQEGHLVDFRIIYVNQAYEKMLGVTLEEIQGKTARELWPGMEEEWFRRHEKAVLTGIPQTFELYHSPTGKYYRCHIYCPWDTRERYCVVFDDVTEQKLAQQREAYLKRMLLAIRNVNQLITQEEEPHQLIEKACHRLVETMSIYSAWIVLFGKEREIIDTAFYSVQQKPESLPQKTAKERINQILTPILLQEASLVISPHLEGVEFLLPKQKENYAVIAGKISFAGRLYGLLLITVPAAYAQDAELLDLTQELINDLGFAMHKIENYKALQEVQKRYQLLAENMPGIVYLCLNDEAWTMVYINDYVKTITGYSREDFLSGRISYAELCHPEDLQPLRELIHNALKEKKPFHAIYRLRNRDGGYRFVEEFGTGIWEEGTLRYLEGFIQDITERKRSEEKIYYLLSHDPLTNLYNRIFLEQAIHKAEENQELPLGILLCDINGLKLINEALGHQEGNQMLQRLAQILDELCPPQALVGRWSGDEFMVIIPHAREENLRDLVQSITVRCQWESRESEKLPLSVSMGWSIKNDPEQSMDQILNQAMERMHRRKLTESRSARSAIITSLEQSLRETTQETQQHATRMAHLARKIGEKLGLREDELISLELLARLHDLGKIAIPLHVLNKPGPLTRDEWELVKKHPEVGYRIAQSSADLFPIAEAILAHHERFDGKGYPRGLKGEEIPLIARILAVVDAYDVMIQGRPYKKAMTHQEAIQELKRCSGTQFDPWVVEVFIELLDGQSVESGD